jgi:hypothetical protein
MEVTPASLLRLLGKKSLLNSSGIYFHLQCKLIVALLYYCQALLFLLIELIHTFGELNPPFLLKLRRFLLLVSSSLKQIEHALVLLLDFLLPNEFLLRLLLQKLLDCTLFFLLKLLQLALGLF